MNKMKNDSKWIGLRSEVTEYCKENKISENDFMFLGIYEWKNVYSKVLEHFVDERYARNHGLYWSNTEDGFKRNIERIYSFREGVENHVSYEWIEKLPEIAKCEKVYLLLEEDKQHTKYWIAECSTKIVHAIINEAIYPTDYYITDKKFNWLITENHHDIVQFIGTGLDLGVIKTVCTK